jgi:hypothetical protein
MRHALPRRTVRAVALTLVLAVAALGGCFGANEEGLAGDDSGAPPPRDGVCAFDSDCVGAGASCCSCAEYAVSIDSEWAHACEDVDCPTPTPGTCTNAVPRCSPDGVCVLGCATIACDQTCDAGFAVDDAGCLTCDCAPAPVPECMTDDQCTRVAADCCGCAMGGSDIAIPTDQVPAHDAGLGCPTMPVCPGVDVCVPGEEVARCDMGRCGLGSGSDTLPAGACGTPDLPPCPAGQACVLNSDDGATMQGLGVCQ